MAPLPLPLGHVMELKAACPECGMNPINILMTDSGGTCCWCGVRCWVHRGEAKGEAKGGWVVEPAFDAHPKPKPRRRGRPKGPARAPTGEVATTRVSFVVEHTPKGWEWSVRWRGECWGGVVSTKHAAKDAIDDRLAKIWSAGWASKTR